MFRFMYTRKILHDSEATERMLIDQISEFWKQDDSDG